MEIAAATTETALAAVETQAKAATFVD